MPKVAIAQFSPVHLDLQASLERMTGIIETAANQGVELLVFGETWLSGYPAWLDHCPNVAIWNYQPMKEVFKTFYNNSIVVGGKATSLIASLAKKHNMSVCVGVNERVPSGPGNGTVYNSLLTFSNNGQLINHHRKLVPTFTEKLVYGNGDGKGLRAVDTPLGRIGGLICWEHWMPLSRQAMHDSGEHIHIAVWPTVHEKHQIASRHYAFEGRCFVLAAGLLMQAKDIPKHLSLPFHLKNAPNEFLLRGGSCIISPNGDYLVPPVFDKEALIIGTIDLEDTIKERMALDTSGHYQRSDIFDFTVNNTRKG